MGSVGLGYTWRGLVDNFVFYVSFIRDVLFIVAVSFICCNLKKTFYTAMLIIFAVSMVIDIAGLIYSAI